MTSSYAGATPNMPTSPLFWHFIVGFHPKEKLLLFFRNEVTWIELQEKASEYTILHCTDRVTHGLDFQEYHQIFILPIFQNHQFNANWDTSDKARKCVDFFFSCDVMTFTLGPLLMFTFHGDSNFTQRNQPFSQKRVFQWTPLLCGCFWGANKCKGISLQQIKYFAIACPKTVPPNIFLVINSIKSICKHNVKETRSWRSLYCLSGLAGNCCYDVSDVLSINHGIDYYIVLSSSILDPQKWPTVHHIPLEFLMYKSGRTSGQVAQGLGLGLTFTQTTRL